ncbi:hypothetical protein ACTEZU_09580 [Lactiplantibacillus plantarum]
MGPQGATGATGPKGDKGDVGATGISKVLDLSFQAICRTGYLYTLLRQS